MSTDGQIGYVTKDIQRIPGLNAKVAMLEGDLKALQDECNELKRRLNIRGDAAREWMLGPNIKGLFLAFQAGAGWMRKQVLDLQEPLEPELPEEEQRMIIDPEKTRRL